MGVFDVRAFIDKPYITFGTLLNGTARLILRPLLILHLEWLEYLHSSASWSMTRQLVGETWLHSVALGYNTRRCRAEACVETPESRLECNTTQS